MRIIRSQPRLNCVSNVGEHVKWWQPNYLFSYQATNVAKELLCDATSYVFLFVDHGTEEG
jgi:hypothetical protein